MSIEGHSGDTTAQPSMRESSGVQNLRQSVSSTSTPSALQYGPRLVNPMNKTRWQGTAGHNNLLEGVVHVRNTFNNTIMTLTDPAGKVRTWTSCGMIGYKNAQKSTPIATEKAADELARKALKLGFYSVVVRLNGMGKNKQYAVQALHKAGLRISQLQDVTPIAYNGCRLPRKRRT